MSDDNSKISNYKESIQLTFDTIIKDKLVDEQNKNVQENEKNFPQNYLKLPSSDLTRFINTESYEGFTEKGRSAIFFKGKILQDENMLVCPYCGGKLYRDGSYEACISHVSIGSKVSKLKIMLNKLYCSQCNLTFPHILT